MYGDIHENHIIWKFLFSYRIKVRVEKSSLFIDFDAFAQRRES
jgi:hypothetical protein